MEAKKYIIEIRNNANTDKYDDSDLLVEPNDSFSMPNGKVNLKGDTKTKSRDSMGVKTSVSGAMLTSIAQNVFGHVTSYVGLISGSNNEQDKVNNAISAMATVGAIATNPIMGLSGLAIDLGFKLFDYNYHKKWSDLEAERLQKRAGLSTSKDRI